ncbi:type I-C CRISPR-associated endonuclease Cas1c [Porphyromonas pogonae]|uniref:type I-C CRISPR-associated endonuclease Cas1c n=1 Tax=Porphyromonas pogonae TaxID=867595 RepID=UPI002E77074F|nr:type I-C CRISPR-associated endonuclease Cas1c [Porphyromonas pogonae]
MRLLLNTLYINTPNAYLNKDGENLVVKVEQAEVFRIPIHNLEEVVMFSYMGASLGAIHLCNEHNVHLAFHKPNGEYIGSVEGPVKGNVILRNSQFRVADDELIAAHIAKIIVAGKIKNQRAVLHRFQRDYKDRVSDPDRFQYILDLMASYMTQALSCKDRKQLLGIEGNAAKLYFEALPNLCLNIDFAFQGRSKRPPKDPFNALLSFFYSLLTHSIKHALMSAGLDPYVGFYHVNRPGRVGLALDLIEELRPYLVDRFVLSLINNRMIKLNDFIRQQDKAVLLTDEARRKVIQTWQQRKKEELIHPYIKERIPLGLLPHVQARLLANYIRGVLDDYPVFIMP